MPHSFSKSVVVLLLLIATILLIPSPTHAAFKRCSDPDCKSCFITSVQPGQCWATAEGNSGLYECNEQGNVQLYVHKGTTVCDGDSPTVVPLGEPDTCQRSGDNVVGPSFMVTGC